MPKPSSSLNEYDPFADDHTINIHQHEKWNKFLWFYWRVPPTCNQYPDFWEWNESLSFEEKRCIATGPGSDYFTINSFFLLFIYL